MFIEKLTTRRRVRHLNKQLRRLTRTLNKQHAWVYDWYADRFWDTQHQFRDSAGQWHGSTPPWCGPCGDYMICQDCGAHAIENEPSR